MAQVTMDSSEYELMKENKTLLEKSLEKERELSAEIDRLNNQIIENYKKTEKQVLITKREYITEEIVESSDYDHIINKITDIYEETKRNLIDNRYYIPRETFTNKLKDQLFNVIRTDKEPVETYSFKNLDDVIPDITSFLKSQIDEETKQKLSTIPEFKRSIDILKSTNKELKDSNSNLKSENKKLDSDLKNLKIGYDELKQMITCHTWQDFAIFEIKDTLLQLNIFNFKKLKNKILDLIDTKPPMKLMFDDDNTKKTI